MYFAYYCLLLNIFLQFCNPRPMPLSFFNEDEQDIGHTANGRSIRTTEAKSKYSPQLKTFFPIICG